MCLLCICGVVEALHLALGWFLVWRTLSYYQWVILPCCSNILANTFSSINKGGFLMVYHVFINEKPQTYREILSS